MSESKLSQSNVLQENQGDTPPVEEKEPNIEEDNEEDSAIVEQNVQEEEKKVNEDRLSPFLQTAAYLLDVNASKVSIFITIIDI